MVAYMSVGHISYAHMYILSNKAVSINLGLIRLMPAVRKERGVEDACRIEMYVYITK